MATQDFGCLGFLMKFVAPRTLKKKPVWGLLLLALIVTVWFIVPHKGNKDGKPDQKNQPISVKTDTAKQGDFEIHLNALGNVTAFNTTTVRSRVTGELLKIYFKEGQNVQQGDLLAEIDPRMYQSQMDQAAGKLASDKAQLQFAEAELERDKHLMEKGYIALSQLQTQNASVNQLRGMIATDQGQIDNAKLQLSFCQIRAPLSGRIGLKLVDLGNILNVLDPVVVITQLQPISVIFNVPQDQNPLVQQRMIESPNLAIEAYDRDGTTLLATGQIWGADNLIDTSTGTLRMKAVFENKNAQLYPNQFVNVRLLLEVLKDKVFVPRASVQQDPKGYHVFAVNSDNTIKVKPVAIGASEGNFTVIDSGLAAGEVVVTDGLDKLREGVKVRPPDVPKGPEPFAGESDPSKKQ